MRDAYPGGQTAGGMPLVDGVQRGIAVVVDNNSILSFFMHGGTIDDFQKQAGLFVRADLDISGVTVIGGGAQTVIAQNGFSIQRSTGSVSGNVMTNIGYAGPALAYSGVILASSNFDLAITGNVVGGSNVESAAAKVVGIWVFISSVANSGGEISGNTITHTDVGIAVDDTVTPNPLFIENNDISSGDLTDSFSAGVRFEPMPIATATPFDIDGSAMGDKLSGNAGDDILSGLAGDDLLRGNGGDDRLDGGSGADSMTGGTGDDLYFVDDMGDVVIEAAGEGNDEVRTSVAAYVLPDNVETITGTRVGSQDLRGNSGDNVFTSEDSSHADIFRLQDGATTARAASAGATSSTSAGPSRQRTASTAAAIPTSSSSRGIIMQRSRSARSSISETWARSRSLQPPTLPTEARAVASTPTISSPPTGTSRRARSSRSTPRTCRPART